MRAGRLGRRVTIQRKSISYSVSGQQTETWSDLATRWAYVAPVSGDERYTQPQLVARQQVEFGVRWSSNIAELSPLDRISYEGSIYDILEVHEVGRREGLKIIAERRTDTA